MELLKFTVRNQNLSGGRAKIVSDTVDYIEVFFDFLTDDWKNISKWAHFSKDGTTYDVNLVDDRITKDMHLNLGAGTWKLKLHGTDPNGTMRITTDTVHINVESYGSLEEGAPLPEILLSAAEQIDAKSQFAVDTANEVMRMAKGGEFDPVRGVDYWTEEDCAQVVAQAVELVKEGAKGETGKSAYEYAVEGGYAGSEDDFMEDLALSDERFSAIEKDIADLKYIPVSVSSFDHQAGMKENGDVVSSVVLSWELNKKPERVLVDGTEVMAEKNGSHTVNGNFDNTTKFVIEATDERGAKATDSAVLCFYDGIYYGMAEEPETPDSGFILSLTKKLSGGKNLTVNVSGNENEYFWYAYPKSMGESKFNIGGFDYEYAAETVLFTNVFGVAKDYCVYRSGQPIIGSVSITVKEG